MLLLLPLLAACAGGRATSAPPALFLARHPEALRALELPGTCLPGGAATPARVAVTTPFERVWGEDGLEQYRTRLPVRQVFYGHTLRVPPAGMLLLDNTGQEVPFELDRTLHPDRLTWRAREAELLVRPARGAPPPGPADLTLVYPRAAAWQDGLDPARSGCAGVSCALREVTLDSEAFHGLLLPAPARAVFEVEVPARGRLAFDARVLPRAVEVGDASDGAMLRVSLLLGEAREVLARRPLGTGTWRHVEIDLGTRAGRRVLLEFSTEPRGNPTLDFAFLANPVVYTQTAHPRHAVLVFIDTLRRDHVGLYGYERDTTPALDAWAADAAVFMDARATSSWTLPSMQALLTGAPQGSWGQIPTLQERLGTAGFSTAAFVSNAFMTDAFGMAGGWGEYRYQLLNPAAKQVDLALGFLERHEERDALVMVQFMDAHMPYREGGPFAGLWAGERPEGFSGGLTRKELRGLRLPGDQRAAVEGYVVARYDESVRAIDEQVGRLLVGLDEDDVVVVFGDHGEEFWDHGGVEHGHALWDELLEVPLLVRAPGVRPARLTQPVSLVDVAPTVFDLLGQGRLPQARGRSLAPLLRGEPDATFDARARFFGDLLYGDESWGVLTPQGTKWTVRGGRQAVFDLASDPDEAHDLVRPGEGGLDPYPAALGEALGEPVRAVWRIEGHGNGRNVQGLVARVELRKPGGFAQVWTPTCLTNDSAAPRLEGEALVMESAPGAWLPREVFLIPTADPLDPTGVELTVRAGDEVAVGAWSPTRPALSTSDGRHHLVAAAGRGAAHFSVDVSVAPVPVAEEAATAPGADVADHLKTLGYLD